jgi:hypothetical protein
MRYSKTLSLLAIALIPLSAFVCDEDAQPLVCNESAQEVTILDNFVSTLPVGERCSIKNATYNDSGLEFIIQTQEDFDKHVLCSVTHSVDFSKYTLLAGTYLTANIDHVISQTVTKTCDEYKYVSAIGGGVSTSSALVSYFAVIPKISDDAKVTFEVINDK